MRTNVEANTERLTRYAQHGAVPHMTYLNGGWWVLSEGYRYGPVAWHDRLLVAPFLEQWMAKR